jgi:signal transduction histidine kinase/CheY-like chemotaxis protein/HPt (histidine-containing phosphotransfer) domain-containing protein
MAVGRPLIDLFHEMDMKIMISEILVTKGAYEGTKELNRNGEIIYFKIIANDLQGSTKGKFIDISDITPIMEAQLEAEKAAAAKSSFLANTSHEIRTPMNAILGMVELLLRKDIAPDVYENALAIRQAGSNLLAIINEILDFSKIESGKLEIVPTDYLFASLINDVISIIRMRIAEKPILFIVDVDPRLPNKLKGDEVRIRQILLNLLSNAVKYTKKGHITLTITGAKAELPTKLPLEEDDQISLTITVADTGVGIKKEDMGKLFGEFVQFDSHKNRGIEGTGLGLAISRNLCRLMGGDITVESRYGEGSVFTATLPQRIQDGNPFAWVDAPETKPVLLYEKREPYAASLIRSLKNLAVPVRAVLEPGDLYQELARSHNAERPYSLVFVSADMVEKTLNLIKTLELETLPVALSDVGEISSFQNVPIISMPAYVLSLANALNGKQAVSYHEKTSAAFIAPDAKILIVDDNVTNLTVAQGLLALYQMDIHVCTSGMEAVSLVKKHSYDLIFMDHMMPDMDGIETTAFIRALGGAFQDMPIVALTANAISGMREMFLEKGFSDFLAKPIEIAKLNEIIRKWIPKNKQRKSAVENPPLSAAGSAGETAVRPAQTAIQIPGLDTERGFSMTGGTEAGYRKVLASFYRDALERLTRLKDVPDEEELLTFTTQVHALKSAAATIGAVELSKKAAALEAAGKAGDLTVIREGLPPFYEHLEETARHIGQALGLSPADSPSPPPPLSAELMPLSKELRLSFEELREALEKKDMTTMDRIIVELEGKNLDEKTKATVEKISDEVLVTEFDAALALLKRWLI